MCKWNSYRSHVRWLSAHVRSSNNVKSFFWMRKEIYYLHSNVLWKTEFTVGCVIVGVLQSPAKARQCYTCKFTNQHIFLLQETFLDVQAISYAPDRPMASLPIISASNRSHLLEGTSSHSRNHRPLSHAWSTWQKSHVLQIFHNGTRELPEDPSGCLGDDALCRKYRCQPDVGCTSFKLRDISLGSKRNPFYAGHVTLTKLPGAHELVFWSQGMVLRKVKWHPGNMTAGGLIFDGWTSE